MQSVTQESLPKHFLPQVLISDSKAALPLEVQMPWSVKSPQAAAARDTVLFTFLDATISVTAITPVDAEGGVSPEHVSKAGTQFLTVHALQDAEAPVMHLNQHLEAVH